MVVLIGSGIAHRASGRFCGDDQRLRLYDACMPCGMGVEVRWVPVRQTVSKDERVHTEDRVTVQVKLLPVLEPEQLGHILREELERLGWTRCGDGAMTKVIGRATATLAAGSDTIVIEIASETTVRATATVEARASAEDVKRQANAAADKRLAKEVADTKASLIAANIRELEHALVVVQQEATQATNATTKRALEQRAATLGAIEQTIEGRDDNGGYELTLMVKT